MIIISATGKVNPVELEEDYMSKKIVVITGRFGTVRFNELKKYIGTISYKTLSVTLKELEADNLVHREEYPRRIGGRLYE